MTDEQELQAWREFRSICNSVEEKNGREMKPVRLTLSSCRVMKAGRLRELTQQLELKIDAPMKSEKEEK